MLLQEPDWLSVLFARFIKFDCFARDAAHLEYFEMLILIVLVGSAFELRVSVSVYILAPAVSPSIWDTLFR